MGLYAFCACCFDEAVKTAVWIDESNAEMVGPNQFRYRRFLGDRREHEKL
jgi:hypothetical protein